MKLFILSSFESSFIEVYLWCNIELIGSELGIVRYEKQLRKTCFIKHKNTSTLNILAMKNGTFQRLCFDSSCKSRNLNKLFDILKWKDNCFPKLW